MSVEFYAEEFPKWLSQYWGNDSHVLKHRRQEGFNRFSSLGFPSVRDEEWRYTNLTVLNRNAFRLGDEVAIDPSVVAVNSIKGAIKLVFVNGWFSPEQSDLEKLPEGVSVISVRDALKQNPDLVLGRLSQVVKDEEHSLVALNTASFTDGLLITVEPGSKADHLFHVLHFVTREDALASTRHLIVMNENSHINVLESFHSLGAKRYFTLSVTETLLCQEASIEWHKLQDEGQEAVHFGGHYLKQQEASELIHHNFAFGSLLARTDIHTDLSRRSDCTLLGLYSGHGHQHLDSHTRIRHAEPVATSQEYYKGILNDHSRGVFQGRIIVDQDAQQTDSEMNNRNLLLSPDAEIDTKPQLEIFADDVKCSHGVTVGQLDEKSLFYLASRGIGEDDAKNVLTFAFANEMVEKVKHSGIKDLLQIRLVQQFPGVSIQSL